MSVPPAEAPSSGPSPTPPDVAALIAAGARAVEALAPALLGLVPAVEERADFDHAIARGHFTPAEDDRVRAWFARYLTARAGLLETLADLRPLARGETRGIDVDERLRGFVVAYTAASLLVRAGRLLVSDIATHTIVQRKLNEAAPEHRIPRKQYTHVYRSLTRPVNAWRLAQGLEYATSHRAAMESLRRDPVLAPVLAILDEAEPALQVGVRTYLRARLRYRWHAWRRRHVSGIEQGVFRVFEVGGRVVADLRSPWHRTRISSAQREQAGSLLEPGDVVITRRDRVASNLLLPGYWPHAALHVGPASTREALGVAGGISALERWVEPLRFLEARKDGVRLRALDDTLAVDAFAVIRPRLAPDEIGRALANALRHEGKLYNFDFDFLTTDRLVCTEVVYRAYDGVGDLAFRLARRAGRLTLSAEDILDMAVEGRGFEVVCVCGTPGLGRRLVTGEDATAALAESYRGEKD